MKKKKVISAIVLFGLALSSCKGCPSPDHEHDPIKRDASALNLDLATLDAAIAAFPDNTAIAAAVKNAFLTASKALKHAVAVINNPVNADMNAFDVAKNFTSDAAAARTAAADAVRDLDATTAIAADADAARSNATRARADANSIFPDFFNDRRRFNGYHYSGPFYNGPAATARELDAATAYVTACDLASDLDSAANATTAAHVAAHDLAATLTAAPTTRTVINSIFRDRFSFSDEDRRRFFHTPSSARDFFADLSASDRARRLEAIRNFIGGSTIHTAAYAAAHAAHVAARDRYRDLETTYKTFTAAIATAYFVTAFAEYAVAKVVERKNANCHCNCSPDACAANNSIFGDFFSNHTFSRYHLSIQLDTSALADPYAAPTYKLASKAQQLRISRSNRFIF